MTMRWVVAALLSAVLSATTMYLGPPASATTAAWAAKVRPAKCDRFDREAADRRANDQGVGHRVVVIGDSFSVGTGLGELFASWPSRLPGRVHVDGHSGSGFSATSSPCGTAYAFSRRALRAVRGGSELVVVQGGLNDWDRTNAEIALGFARLMHRLDGRQVLVVGPVQVRAPALAGQVRRLDRVLNAQSRKHGVPYLRMSGMSLGYHRDQVHLSQRGHDAFGIRVAASVTRILAAG